MVPNIMARSDRISRLPQDILDHILVSFPIQDIAKTAVLSTFWRDLWFTLPQLCFDLQFFSYCDKKYQGSQYVEQSGGLNIINKVLLQHRGKIRKFVIDLYDVPTQTFTSWSFDVDQWLHSVTCKGVAEVHLKLGQGLYKLPNLWQSEIVLVATCATFSRLPLFVLLIWTTSLLRCL
ncbi:unnamed protein product [Cuscuta europaea]|uniref:F-box domain-containing protein n=1 Tax=Cuscuta europaea TaxID=41803 RepID=A0A9P0ZZW0_CUSEU|nr:unnamed protein product [Cuscuta europaea]